MGLRAALNDKISNDAQVRYVELAKAVRRLSYCRSVSFGSSDRRRSGTPTEVCIEHRHNLPFLRSMFLNIKQERTTQIVPVQEATSKLLDQNDPRTIGCILPAIS